MASDLNARLAQRLGAINREQRAIQEKIRSLQRRFNELERQRKNILKSIDKVAAKLERMSNTTITRTLILDVEREINREGWMERIIENRFKHQAEHGRGSTKWAKLAPSTIRRKGFNRILFDTGEMYQGALNAVSGTYRFQKTPRWNIDDVGVEYARYMQEGTDRAPARPFLDDPTDKEMQPVEERALKLLKDRIRKELKA